MITEHLMRPGSGSVRFIPGIPVSYTEAIRSLVDENNSGVGASLVITPSQVNVDAYSDAEILSQALYTGAISARPSRLSLEVVGISSWLDTYFDTAITRSSGTPTQWLGDLVANGITAGTVTGGSNVSRTFLEHSATRRECLDAWAGLAGVEYRVNPDFTIDVAAASTLFQSPPVVVVTKRDEGPDGAYRGVEGGLLDQALTSLGPSIATKAVALAEGEGASIAKGTATRSVNLKTPAGGTPTIITVLSAPSEESANADTLASNFLNLQGMRRQVNVGSKTYGLPRFVKPGDEVYVWDPSAGLYDTANQIQFRGETIFPVKVRLLSYTWPIERGMGVYVRSNAASPTYIDVTDWVEWEDGSETWWTVGDWNPPSYGSTNRSAPEIEERIAGIVGGVSRLRRVANQTLAATSLTTISFDTEDADPLGVAATGTTPLTLTPGAWIITAFVDAAVSLSGASYLRIAADRSYDLATAVGADDKQGYTIMVYVPSGTQTVQVSVYNATAGGIAAQAWLEAVRISL